MKYFSLIAVTCFLMAASAQAQQKQQYQDFGSVGLDGIVANGTLPGFQLNVVRVTENVDLNLILGSRSGVNPDSKTLFGVDVFLHPDSKKRLTGGGGTILMADPTTANEVLTAGLHLKNKEGTSTTRLIGMGGAYWDRMVTPFGVQGPTGYQAGGAISKSADITNVIDLYGSVQGALLYGMAVEEDPNQFGPRGDVDLSLNRGYAMKITTGVRVNVCKWAYLKGEVIANDVDYKTGESNDPSKSKPVRTKHTDIYANFGAGFTLK